RTGGSSTRRLSAALQSLQKFLPSGLPPPQLVQVITALTFRRSPRRREVSESSSQLLQQRLRVLQVARVEAFGEPGVDRGEEGAGRVALALAMPEQRQP